MLEKVTLIDVKEPNNINIIDLERLYPFLNKRITGQCSICEGNLTNKFPDDFPDEWKFCCACRLCASWIIKGETPRSHRFKEIYKRITLVGK